MNGFTEWHYLLFKGLFYENLKKITSIKFLGKNNVIPMFWLICLILNDCKIMFYAVFEVYGMYFAV